MDNLSAGTASSLSFEKGRTYQPTVQRRYRLSLIDSTKPATDSNTAGKLDAFPAGIAGCFRLESLDDFDWNQWMLSIGIGG
jgi:hypothetical protein